MCRPTAPDDRQHRRHLIVLPPRHNKCSASIDTSNLRMSLARRRLDIPSVATKRLGIGIGLRIRHIVRKMCVWVAREERVRRALAENSESRVGFPVVECMGLRALNQFKIPD